MALSEDIACIARQEAQLHFPRFDDDAAWALGGLLRGWAAAQGWPLVIDVRRFDRPLFYAALPGSVPDQADWVRRKSNVVQRFHRSSYRIGLELAQKQAGATLESRYGLPAADYASHGGAFPLHVEGTGVIGSVAVSGLPQREDHALVVRAVCESLGRDPAGFALPGS